MDFSLLSSIRLEGSVALQVRELHKFYWSGGCKTSHVLRALNMDVPYGAM